MPWLTRLGGEPWREANKAWPTDERGIPLTFLGQMCFVDSRDIHPFKLPGDVLLFFGQASRGGEWIDANSESIAIEWSSLTLKEPCSIVDCPWSAQLPFEFDGVLHRTVQYVDDDQVDAVCRKVGIEYGSQGLGRFLGTCISSSANLPQGWPFMEGDGHTLLAVLSSVSSYGQWPLCDLESAMPEIRNDQGERRKATNRSFNFNIGDAGAIYVYRTKDGVFKVDCDCG